MKLAKKASFKLFPKWVESQSDILTGNQSGGHWVTIVTVILPFLGTVLEVWRCRVRSRGTADTRGFLHSLCAECLQHLPQVARPCLLLTSHTSCWPHSKGMRFRSSLHPFFFLPCCSQAQGFHFCFVHRAMMKSSTLCLTGSTCSAEPFPARGLSFTEHATAHFKSVMLVVESWERDLVPQFLCSCIKL